MDDDDTVRFLLRLTVEKMGFTVLEAADGESALALASEADVILLDLLLPGIDGLSMIPLLREVAPSVVIVVVSGMPPGGAVEAAARASGVTTYIDKADLLMMGPALTSVLTALT